MNNQKSEIRKPENSGNQKSGNTGNQEIRNQENGNPGIQTWLCPKIQKSQNTGTQETQLHKSEIRNQETIKLRKS